jgi:hypothetical protein
VGDGVGEGVGERVGDGVGEAVTTTGGAVVTTGFGVGERVGERVGDGVGRGFATQVCRSVAVFPTRLLASVTEAVMESLVLPCGAVALVQVTDAFPFVSEVAVRGQPVLGPAFWAKSTQ